MSTRVITNLLVGVAVILASLAFRILAHGQEMIPMTPAERIDLIASTKASCVRDYIGQLDKPLVEKYCDCVAKRITEQITTDELRAAGVTPELQKRVEAQCWPGSAPR